ncbi:carbohydrate-binding module family 50 protein [Trichoderma sp. SZMC 28013]
MAPTFLKAGLVLLSQLHLAWALVPRAPTTSSLASNLLDITGTRADCIAWRKAQDGEDCTVFEKPFGLSQNEFIALNNKMDPVINKECTNLIAGKVYCVEVPSSSSFSIPTSAKTTLDTAKTTLATATAMTTMTTMTTTTTTTKTGTSSVVTPTPYQSGMVNNCYKFFFVEDKDTTCYSIAQEKSVSINDILKWNPGMKGDCNNLWLHNNICIGAPA